MRTCMISQWMTSDCWMLRSFVNCIQKSFALKSFVCSCWRPMLPKHPAISCYWLINSATRMLIKINSPVVSNIRSSVPLFHLDLFTSLTPRTPTPHPHPSPAPPPHTSTPLQLQDGQYDECHPQLWPPSGRWRCWSTVVGRLQENAGTASQHVARHEVTVDVRTCATQSERPAHLEYRVLAKMLSMVLATHSVVKYKICFAYLYRVLYLLFITTNSVEAPTVRSTIHMHFKLNYNTGYTYL